MFFYKIQDEIAFSLKQYNELKEISELEAMRSDEIIYFLTSMDPKTSRKTFSISDPSLLHISKEDLNLLVKPSEDQPFIKDWLLSKIDSKKIMSINTSYNNWEVSLNYTIPSKWKINLVGLGDVGGTLLTGLRLLGGKCISEVGIYSRSKESVTRWELETNQILNAFSQEDYPIIKGIAIEKLFDCDMFIFCASKNVPPVGQNVGDVRLYQFEGNSKIISEYAYLARQNNFKGIFAVVSDPVDLLCKVALIESNKDENGAIDYNGLSPEQIRGYGLGVMNARAAYYSSMNPLTAGYIHEGRAFGPHGKGLVIANSIYNYDEELSIYLTEKTLGANLEVREVGYKPYVAPALSSGALSIISTIESKWHYSATYIGGIYMGAKNRLLPSGTEIERLNLPKALLIRLEETFERLGILYE